MDIASEVEKLMNGGYNKDAARAKVAHDIVLAAIRAAGFKDRSKWGCLQPCKLLGQLF